jgi:hypothetical protein
MSFAFGFQIDSAPTCDIGMEAQSGGISGPEESQGARPEVGGGDPTAQNPSRRPFGWISPDNLVELWRMRRQRDIYCKTVIERSEPIRESLCGDDESRPVSNRRAGFEKTIPLRHVVLREWDDDRSGNNQTFKPHYEKSSSDDETEDGCLYGAEGSVIQSGVYEGGGAVWECSMDLVTYLLDQQRNVSDAIPASMEDLPISQGRYVLELGCGHALPSCALLQEALLSRPHQAEPLQGDAGFAAPSSAKRLMDSTFVMVDYNRSVVESITLPNLILNTMDFLSNEEGSKDEEEVDTGHEDFITARVVEAMLSRHIVLGAGDWMDMSDQLLRGSCSAESSPTGSKATVPETSAWPQDGYFDMILAAETLYTPQAAAETAQLVMRHLHPHRDSVALVASKRYYFGVGGGVDDFLAAIDPTKFHVETVKVVDTGVGNIREILKVTHRTMPSQACTATHFA